MWNAFWKVNSVFCAALEYFQMGFSVMHQQDFEYTWSNKVWVLFYTPKGKFDGLLRFQKARMSNILHLKLYPAVRKYEYHFGAKGCGRPGPLKCFNAPRHQILAKSAPQKACTCDKAEFATKVRKSSKSDLNPKNLKGHIWVRILFEEGIFEPNPNMIHRAYLMIWPKKSA